MQEFQPFCFAGLNGSGKSNVLEALSAIFFHLEMCVAKFSPVSFKNHFKREKCPVEAFELEYLICPDIVDTKDYNLAHAHKVTIIKELEEDPIMYVQSKPYETDDKGFSVSMQTPKGEGLRSPAKAYLPDLVGWLFFRRE